MQAPALPPSLDFPRIKVLAVGSSACGKSCLIKRYCEGRFVSKYIPTIGIDYGVKKVDLKPGLVAQHRQKLGASQHRGVSGSGSGMNNSSDSVTAVRVNFWDVAGGDESLHIRNEFYAPAQGIFLMFDVRQRQSFEDLDNWLAEMDAYTTGTGSTGGAANPRRTSQTTTSNTPAGRAVGDRSGQRPILYLIGTKVDDVADGGSATAASAAATTVRRAVSEAEARQWAERHGCAQYYEASAAADLNVTAAMEGMFYDVVAAFM